MRSGCSLFSVYTAFYWKISISPSCDGLADYEARLPVFSTVLLAVLALFVGTVFLELFFLDQKAVAFLILFVGFVSILAFFLFSWGIESSRFKEAIGTLKD